MSKTRAQKSKHGGSRPRTSNIFSMFDQTQIQEFKEAFNIIDQNRDGFIDARDLSEMMLSLGELRWVLECSALVTDWSYGLGHFVYLSESKLNFCLLFWF